MKQFLIRYQRGHGTEAQWHQDIRQFISAVEKIVAETRAAP